MTPQEKDHYTKLGEHYNSDRIKTWADYYSNGRPAPLCYLTNRPCDVCRFNEDGNGCKKWNCVFEEKIGEVGESE